MKIDNEINELGLEADIETVLIGAVSDNQIAAWKQQHGTVWAATAGDSICYLKEPTRAVLGAATRFGQSDPLKFNETILNNCWLGGDESIRTDNGKFLAVGQQLNALIEVPQSSIKKL